jgi:hypothetical protein
VDVYIVSDRAWTDGDPIPPDVSGVTETVTTDSSGGLGPVEVWPRLLTVGEYDIVFDANQNGVYDALFDAVDDPNHPGFVVQPYPVGGVTAARSSAGLLPLLAALVTLMALVLAGAAVSRRRL